MSRGAGDTFEMVQRNAPKPRPFIALGIPTFGTVNIFWAMRALGMLRHPMNVDIRTFVILSDEVGLARNEIVSKALAVEQQDPTKRCSHVFFLDDDVFVHPDALLKLLADDRDIVSGLYFAKTSVPQPLVLVEDEGTVRKWTPGEIVNCDAHGMGLTLIRADVFRTMVEAGLERDANGNPEWFATTRDALVFGAGGTPAVRNETEDVKFLREARALGYQPSVDTGPQAFGFHFSAAEQRGYPLKQWFEFQQTGRITWTDTPDGVPVVWDVAA